MSVRHALLALLNHAPGHGYQLHGLLAEALGQPWSVNTGQIYSSLARLERDGLVARHGQAAERRNDRTIYTLTGAGKAELVRWFREPLSREHRLRDAFYAKLVLSRLSAAVPPAEVLRAQRKKLMSELHDLTQLRGRVDPERELPWLLLLESGVMHLEADLRWLDLCEERLEGLSRLPPLQYIQRPRGRPRKGAPGIEDN